MKNFWKSIATYLVVALVSIGATYGMYSYLDSKKNYSSNDSYDYGSTFNQKGLHLASLTTDGYPDFTKAAESSIHAVVHIKSTVKGSASAQNRRQIDPFEYFFGFGDRGDREFQSRPQVGFGSGVIISKDGYIVTNNHVIDKATEIEVTLNDNSKYNAKLIGTDPETDIALLKIEGGEFPYIPFGNSDNLKVGEWVLAVGNPFNLTSTVTAGIVSAKGRGGIGDIKSGDIQSFIQTDAAINRGNSGGALVNTNGELVGINTAIYSQTGDFAGYGFAVPISIAGKVVADIKEYGAVQRAVLGVMIQDIAVTKEREPEKTKDLKINEGVYVAEFAEMSPAKQAGILAGDVITAINGVNVRNVSELQEQVSRFRPGDKVSVKVKRGNSDKAFDITLKNSSGSTSVIKKEEVMSNLGVVFKELTDEQKKQYGISTGVVVAGVENGGVFAKKGISKGYIILKMNGESVSTPEEAESMIQSAARSTDKSLFISALTPTGQRKPFAIELE